VAALPLFHGIFSDGMTLLFLTSGEKNFRWRFHPVRSSLVFLYIEATVIGKLPPTDAPF